MKRTFYPKSVRTASAAFACAVAFGLSSFFLPCLCVFSFGAAEAERFFSPEITAHLEFLLDGVDRIGTFGSPGNVVPFGDAAAPLILGTNGRTARISLAAFSQHKKGRVVVFGHSAMIGGEFLFADESASRLTRNMVRWLASGDEAAPVALARIHVAVVSQRDAVEPLRSLGCNVTFFENLPDFSSVKETNAFDLAILNAEHVTSEHIRPLSAFVERGGGILAAATGWGWSQINGGKSVRTEFPANALFAPMGLVWGGEFAGTTLSNGYRVEPRLDPLTHPNHAMGILFHADGEKRLDRQRINQAVKTVEFAIQAVPEPYLENSLEPLRKLSDAKIVPSTQHPIRAEVTPLQRLAMSIQTRNHLKSRKASPGPEHENPFRDAAAEFPGAVSEDAKRVSRTVRIDTAIPDWHSTGLYAPPGETITVTLPANAPPGNRVAEGRENRPLSLRIGSHSDTIWHLDRWERYPEITLQIPLRDETTQVNNPFGGLIYIVVPRNRSGGARDVTIEGAVEAPYFLQGKTTQEQWKHRRDLGTPWAELASEKIVLTVPSRVVRDLDDPSALLDFWNAMLDADAGLIGAPLLRERPERITVDRQISAGYMHSGYPVMCHMDVETDLVDLEKLRTKGNWGFFHEFGHNHQSRDWTFEGTGEVTVNLFSLYNYEVLCGTPRERTRRELNREFRQQKKAAHLAAGAPFDQWKQDPFLALGMYVELLDAFGWEPFKAVFREYRNLSGPHRPRDDEQKRDQWMVRFSKQVGKNLGPFFDRWGVPTSQQAKDAIADLPEWLPEQ